MEIFTGVFAALFDQAATVTWIALVVFTAIYLALFGYWCRLVYALLREWVEQGDADVH